MKPHKRPGLGNLKLYSTRQKPQGRRRGRASPCQLAALRLHDLARLFRARYGVTLPDDDAGRDDMMVAVNHLASLAHPKGRIEKWLDLWVPWLSRAESQQIISEAIVSQQHWTADQLAWRLRLIDEDRTALGITTIGAIDCGKRQRMQRRKAKSKARSASHRTPRPDSSIEREKPWKAEGVSRRTWYRRRKARDTGGTDPYAP